MSDSILKYENLVLSYANKFRYYYDIEDLKQVGMVGLMKAIEIYWYLFENTNLFPLFCFQQHSFI